MKYTEVVCLALWFVLCGSATFARQDVPALESRIIEALKAQEPEWTPIAVIESGRVPLVPSEKKIVVQVWQNSNSHSADVSVFVYSIANRVEAMAWLEPFRNKQVATGWQVSIYQIGDEGYLAKYKDGERFELEFRRGIVVAKIAGDDPRLVKDFAKCIVQQIPAGPNSW